jgi:hypothetical protein
VNIDNPAALHFIMQDDIFLLNSEKELFKERVFEEVAVAVAGDEPEATVAVAVAGDKPEVVVAEAVLEKTIVEEPVVTHTKPVIRYKGSNSNGFVILVHYPLLEFMHDAHSTALENTLKRLGFELNAAAVVNMAQHTSVFFDELLGELQPQKLILMGSNALPQGIASISLNKVQSLGNSMALYTFSFDEMMDSNENKKAFWEQMKAL